MKLFSHASDASTLPNSVERSILLRRKCVADLDPRSAQMQGRIPIEILQGLCFQILHHKCSHEQIADDALNIRLALRRFLFLVQHLWHLAPEIYTSEFINLLLQVDEIFVFLGQTSC